MNSSIGIQWLATELTDEFRRQTARQTDSQTDSGTFVPGCEVIDKLSG